MYTRNNYITVASFDMAEVYFGPCKETDLPCLSPTPGIVSLPCPLSVSAAGTSVSALLLTEIPCCHDSNIIFATRLQYAVHLVALSFFLSWSGGKMTCVCQRGSLLASESGAVASLMNLHGSGGNLHESLMSLVWKNVMEFYDFQQSLSWIKCGITCKSQNSIRAMQRQLQNLKRQFLSNLSSCLLIASI